jgi:predicted transposase/invertase (TIGR01784 family)
MHDKDTTGSRVRENCKHGSVEGRTQKCDPSTLAHSEAVQKIGEFEPIIEEAVKMFDIVTSDPQMRELIRMREDGLHDYNSDIGSAERRGREEGIAIGRSETAKKLLSSGMDMKDISEITGLSENEIRNMKQ